MIIQIYPFHVHFKRLVCARLGKQSSEVFLCVDWCSFSHTYRCVWNNECLLSFRNGSTSNLLAYQICNIGFPIYVCVEKLNALFVRKLTEMIINIPSVKIPLAHSTHCYLAVNVYIHSQPRSHIHSYLLLHIYIRAQCVKSQSLCYSLASLSHLECFGWCDSQQLFPRTSNFFFHSIFNQLSKIFYEHEISEYGSFLRVKFAIRLIHIAHPIKYLESHVKFQTKFSCKKKLEIFQALTEHYEGWVERTRKTTNLRHAHLIFFFFSNL